MASLTALNNKFTALRKVASLELELNKWTKKLKTTFLKK
jgi:hypothetical protein